MTTTQWISMPPAPGGRLPTEEEAAECGDSFDVTMSDGSVQREWSRDEISHWSISHWSPDHHYLQILAWAPGPLPEPYVPPKPEPPKRVELWVNQYKDHRFIHESLEKALEERLDDFIRMIHLREVLPGDIDPDAAREFVKWCRENRESILGSRLEKLLNAFES